MPRDFEVYLEDIRQAIAKIQSYTIDFTRAKFAQDGRTIDAVVRNLLIIGEAAKMVPESIRADYPNIEWKRSRAFATSSLTTTSTLIWILFGMLFGISFRQSNKS